MELYYCANGNKRFAEIAIAAGFSYGAQMPGTVYFPPRMIDQDWKDPNRARYMAALAEHRPYMASVLDWETQPQLPEVLSWAEEAAQYVEVIMLIPKVMGGICQLPRKIGGRPVRLGYSVPTKFGGTELPIWEFSGWPVHLLGGSPGQQMRIARYLSVISADGNMAQKLALYYGRYWQTSRRPYANGWTRLDTAGVRVEADAPYEAFALSCENIMKAWRQVAVVKEE